MTDTSNAAAEAGGETQGQDSGEAPAQENRGDMGVSMTATTSHAKNAELDSRGDGSVSSAADQIPDFINEKFRTAENPMEEQAKAYAEAIKKLTVKTEDLKSQVTEEMREELRKEVEQSLNEGVPEDAGGYEYPEGFETADEDLDQSFREWALRHRLSPEAFQEAAQLYAGTQVNPQQELEKLGANAEARIAKLNEWGSKNIPQELHGAAEKILQTAEAVELFEHFMGMGNDSGYSPQGGSPPQALTREQIRQKQADPRYWNPQERDPTYVAEVQRDWQEYAKRNSR